MTSDRLSGALLLRRRVPRNVADKLVSQADVAAIVGAARGTYAQWERGERIGQIQLIHLVALAKWLEMEISEVIVLAQADIEADRACAK